MNDQTNPSPATSKNFDYSVANYQSHPLSRLAGHRLISALRPFPKTRKELKALLNNLPDYSPEERNLPRALRKMQLPQLLRAFVALRRNCELAEYMYATICEGYVAREPHSAKSNAILQGLHECISLQQFGARKRVANTAQFCSSLTGMPGSGKSSTFSHIVASLYEPIIYHADINVWQIPVLTIEMAYNGTSQATLAHAIISAIAKLYPDGDYERLYLRPRMNAEERLLAAFTLIHIHCVGMVVVDEAQNRDYAADRSTGARKLGVGQAPLATLLITASNRLEVPLLLVGTIELEESIGTRLSKTRRLPGLPHWGPLTLEGTEKKPSEYHIFLSLLWQYQWLQEPPELTDRMYNLFHYYTAGVPDFMVKLFYYVQWDCLQEEEETFDEETIHRVAHKRMASIVKVTKAIHTRDKTSLTMLAQIPDLAPDLGLSPTKIPSELLAPASHADVDPAEAVSPFPYRARPAHRRKASPIDAAQPADFESLSE
ncbi:MULTISPECIES: ATP-binding protein [unclassified Variovorax]|uniref:ATP-binding protein n=1 Tax=unclassified Variovorax TaxID=663243 RepID=UPI0008D29D08|nr:MULTISPECIES: ATP-binding protein [unclassified Variovorax]SEK14927.1 AAA domain-containing protein [Variovorax sp. OK202]SFE06387.1 AAA domain-containing protein [Variovorax sp. OK212]